MTLYIPQGFGIGTAANDIDLLSALDINDPSSDFQPFSLDKQLGDGSIKRMGWAVETWHWQVIRAAERTILKALCPGSSAVVFISTWDSVNDDWAVYEATMIWPREPETKRGGGATVREDFVIKFNALAEQA